LWQLKSLDAGQSGVILMSWKVRGRHPDGSVSSILCDNPEHVRDILIELRSRGYAEVWVEDTERRKIDETTFTRGKQGHADRS
jgi:hypothetical protein